jgi:hypothetical protein
MKITWSRKKIFFIWLIFWIPLSFLFPTHEHFPLGGVFSPVTSVFLPFMGDSTHNTFEFDWKYVYFPALVFWLGYFILLGGMYYIANNKKKQTKGL